MKLKNRKAKVKLKTKLKTKLIYLASPYSDDDERVMNIRAYHVDEILAREYKRTGHAFYPPILISRRIKDMLGPSVGTTFKQWADVDLCVIAHCDEVWVAKIEGWDKSIGVKAEIEFAKSHNIPVKYIRP